MGGNTCIALNSEESIHTQNLYALMHYDGTCIEIFQARTKLVHYRQAAMHRKYIPGKEF